MAKKFDEVRIPFAKMTFSPDVPSTALGPNEYNIGHNVETDVRGIRSVAGDQAIMDAFPGSYEPTYVTGGYRQDGKFWFVIATTDGSWYATDGGDDGWYDITPPTITPTPGFYGQEQNITEAWNGTVVFFNDSKTAPMFWPQGTDANPVPNIIQYSQQIPLDIRSDPGIIPISLTTQRVYFSSAFDITGTPFVAGETIELLGVQPRYFNGIYEVAADAVLTSSNKGYVDILCTVSDAYSSSGQIAPQYSWNYNNQWKSVSATFMRMYNSPNVGSILVAGGLTAINLSDETEKYPVTVQWSQAFGLNQAPTTWTPTVTNVANQLEVPLRGAVVDAFPCNGQFFLSSYWDTVVFSPINYATTSTPILGVRLFNQGRGMLTSNAWANTDKLVYGVDARDIWVFDGQDFTGIGNQRIKNYFYNALDPNYVDRLYMEVNTQKNQVEIYFTSKPEDADPNNPIIDGIPNKMISYRYDLDCWNPPREVFSGTFACESPIWLNSTDSSLPYWTANPGSRTIVYARGVVGSTLIQKDQGYAWYDDTAIESEFRRDNIKLLPDYSGKLLVHRIMPEVVNLGAFPDSAYDELPLPTDDANYDQYRGNITVTVYGANSVASNPTEKTPVTKAIDANGNTTDLSPWAQINQNAFRVNSIKLSNASNSSIWMCSATTWQYTQTEDDH